MHSPRRMLSGAIAIALLCPPAIADDASTEKDVPFLGGFLRETWVRYPTKVGEWETIGERRYDTPDAGVSVRFERKGDETGRIDVFFYPIGVQTANQQAQYAEAERASLRESWREHMADPDDITPLSTIVIPMPAQREDNPRSEGITARVTDFAYEREDTRYNSAMLFAIHRMYAVKLRYSIGENASSRARVRDTLEGFARQLFPALSIDSTGECWALPSVEVLPEGAPDPEGALATTSIDGKTATWVFADRVVVRKSGQADAPLSQILAMSLSGRLIDGCEAPSDTVPVAPEGTRYLHMEYPAPDEQTAPPGEPMRPARSGLG